MGTIQESPAPQSEEAPAPQANNEANPNPETPVVENPNPPVQSENPQNSSGEVAASAGDAGGGGDGPNKPQPTPEGDVGAETPSAKDSEQPKSAPPEGDESEQPKGGPDELAKDSNSEGGPKISKPGATPAKSSGIPALSRIARPCVGHQKPAVPTTPTKSNNSILTEDTDSFIIGDRVWVGGTKPGQIAYIGETQFAPGDWAGIALDQPIGKNDGSVGGIHYFQCEPKRGVFSRLTRLTRIPLPGADESSICTSVYSLSSSPVNNGTRRRVGSPLSPTGSTRSLRKSPPSPALSTSNTSLASTTHVIDFKVGDRVIIKSSQGSKVGILRYMGTADFAAGEWCGVELDEPRGKNDGSVEGKRYFECRPLFGLFAPVTKVSRSPLRYKPGNCVIHSGAGLPPTGIMKRAGSKESMTSMTSSLASAASGARRVRLGINSLTPQKFTPKTPAGYPTRTALQVTY